MSRARALPRRIIVAGDGPVGLLAAIALRQALPATEVLVIGTPPDPAALADRSPTALPFTNGLHDRLGIEEDALIRQAGASHRLVVRYRGWGGPNQLGRAVYGAAVDPVLRTRFAREWGGGPRNAATSRSPGSLGELLAAQGRFCRPSGEISSPLAEIDYAMRWNVPAYRDLLTRVAHGAGVRHVKGAVSAIQLDGKGGIAALAVDGAGMTPADLFVDCTGPQAALLSQLPSAVRRSWSRHLPIRALLVGRPGEPVVSLADSVDLVDGGWRSELAGRDGRQAVLAIAEGVGEAGARVALGVEPAGLIALDPGCAAEPWIGNVVAIGDAAAHFEPLGWLNLDLAHRQIALLLELLPGRDPDPLERAEFNRRAALMAERVRETLAAHYAAPAAAERFAGLELPEELTPALDQYTRRGRLPFFEEAPLLLEEFSALLHALGHPAGESALGLAADPRAAETARAAFAARANAALQAAPPYLDWLGHVLGRA